MRTSAEEKTYNGWTNYETWAVALWWGNDEGSYGTYREAVQRCWREAGADGVATRSENARYALAEWLKSEMEEGNPLTDAPSVYSDLLGAALSEVDWYEITDSWLSDDIEDYESA